MKHIFQTLVSTIVFLSTAHSWALESRCFNMTPTEPINDKTCAPVHVQIQYLDCVTGVQGSKLAAIARFECKKKQLKYWHDDAMLVANIAKSGADYKIVKTYAIGGTVKPKEATPEAVTTPTPSPTPEAAATPTPTPTPGPAIHQKLDAIKWSGSVDVQYAHNKAEPMPVGAPASSTSSGPTGNNKHIYPASYHDQFTLALASLSVSRKAEPFGFELELGFGRTADEIAGANNDASSRNILQALVNYESDFGLKIELGKFSDPVGYESFNTTKNLMATHSYLTHFLLPAWMTGVRISQDFWGYAELTGFASNGWATTYETNRTKSVGAKLDITPGHGIKGQVAYLGGNETSTTVGKDVRTILDASLEYDVLQQGWVKVAAEYAEASEAFNENETLRARSIAGYLQISTPWRISLGGRVEAMTDGMPTFGVMPGGYVEPFTFTNYGGVNINAWSALLRYDYDNFILRAEWRQDVANQPVFTNLEGPANTQNVMVFSGAYKF